MDENLRMVINLTLMGKEISDAIKRKEWDYLEFLQPKILLEVKEVEKAFGIHSWNWQANQEITTK